MTAKRLRSLLAPLLTGAVLLATALPTLADGGRDYRRYDPPGHSDRGRDHHDYRSDKRYHDHHKKEHRYDDKHRHPGVVYRYYHPRVVYHTPPPRVIYRYDPGVVVQLSPIVIRLD